MKRDRVKFDDWETCRQFMDKAADLLDLTVEEQDARLVIDGDNFSISCQLYFEGDAAGVIRYEENNYPKAISSLASKYQSE